MIEGVKKRGSLFSSYLQIIRSFHQFDIVEVLLISNHDRSNIVWMLIQLQIVDEHILIRLAIDRVRAMPKNIDPKVFKLFLHTFTPDEVDFLVDFG